VSLVHPWSEFYFPAFRNPEPMSPVCLLHIQRGTAPRECWYQQSPDRRWNLQKVYPPITLASLPSFLGQALGIAQDLRTLWRLTTAPTCKSTNPQPESLRQGENPVSRDSVVTMIGLEGLLPVSNNKCCFCKTNFTQV
jgi:hypothetical protein